MKELQNKVIRLGVDRGYLPKNAFDNVEEKFAIQYERLIEEIGEAFRELRLRDQDNFDNEYGDVTVLYTNCRYIINNYADAPEYVRMLDIAGDLIKIMERRASELFLRDYTRYEAYDRCLQLAYDKIKERGGILIGNDYFKPTDPEYIKYMQVNLGDYVNHNNEVYEVIDIIDNGESLALRTHGSGFIEVFASEVTKI